MFDRGTGASGFMRKKLLGRTRWFLFIRGGVGMSLSRGPWLVAFPLAAVGVIVALWVLRRRIGRGPIVAVLFFAGTLLPALGFVNLYPMRYSFVADHFQYHASIGLIVLAAAGVRHLRAIGCGDFGGTGISDLAAGGDLSESTGAVAEYGSA